MDKTSGSQRPFVLSYVSLRRSVGIIGMALPLVLIFGRIILESPGILDSISAYYYSVMRDVFVGSLCAIAVFLFSYRYEIQDDIAGNLAGVFAIGVALFPVVPQVNNPTPQQMMIGWLHLLFAACFFSTLAYFAIVLFRKTDQNEKPTRQKQRSRKQQRDIIYLCCGIAIIVCLVLIIVVQFLPGNLWLHPVFWLETLAIMAFGVSWFVKGETILRDK
jgi:uncharacterized membrane protein